MSNGPIEFFVLSAVTLLGVYCVVDIFKSDFNWVVTLSGLGTISKNTGAILVET